VAKISSIFATALSIVNLRKKYRKRRITGTQNTAILYTEIGMPIGEMQLGQEFVQVGHRGPNARWLHPVSQPRRPSLYVPLLIYVFICANQPLAALST
jgi:hypothetical protein